MKLAELRVSWAILGILLGLVLLDRPGVYWAAAVALPWAAGALTLLLPRTRDAVVATLSQALALTGARLGVLVLGGVLAAVAYVFSMSAALFLVAWGGAALLVLAASGRVHPVHELLVGGAFAAVTVSVVLGVAEMAFRSGPLARRFGAPGERAAWERRYDRLWERNIFNFRSAYETIARRPGVKRVLAVGDSYTWGDKIASADSAWPARLERALRQAYPGSDFEVINTGQRGWTTANEGEFLRRLGWQFDPDLVVIQFDRNDVLWSGPNFARKGEEALYPQVHLVPDRFRTGAIRSSALLAFLEAECSGMRHPVTIAGTEWKALYRDGSPGWTQMQAALREIGDSARARKVPVVWMLFPAFLPGAWTPETYPLRDVHEKLTGYATQAGIHVLDLTPALAAEGGDWQRWNATPWDGHPSIQAHALTARVLAGYIVRNGWVAPRPPSP